MFNRALIDGVYPAQLKVARVTPVFKDGDSNDPSNYRSISILPVLSKVFEKHLNQQVQEYLTTSGLFHKLQCSCRQGYSCIDSVH